MNEEVEILGNSVKKTAAYIDLGNFTIQIVIPVPPDRSHRRNGMYYG